MNEILWRNDHDILYSINGLHPFFIESTCSCVSSMDFRIREVGAESKVLIATEAIRVGWGVMGQRGEMGLFFKLFIKKYKSCINKRLWSR